MIPKVTSVTNREAILELFRSGETYITECEVSAKKTVAYFYRTNSEEAVGRVVVEGDHVGALTNLTQRMMCEDESALPELQRLQAEMHQAQVAH